LKRKEDVMANVLMIHPDKCTGCRSCELACSFEKERQFRPRASRVHVFTWEREGVSVPMMCQQCDPAPCVSVCTPGAMRRNQASGRVEWDDARCIRCRMCVQACPFGNAVYDGRTNAILKCDACDGKPECALFCPNKALEYAEDTLSTRSRKKAFVAKFKEAF
jgi:anaerobic carbon-monoxide dehydrogenase iron sulfur subunit